MRNSPRPDPAPLVVVGVPGSRRMSAFLQATEQLAIHPVRVLSWLDLLGGNAHPPPPGSLIRFESPSECTETTRALLKAGIAPMEAERSRPLSAAQIDALPCDRSELLAPRQWFFGFRNLLENLERDWADSSPRWLASPSSIVTMFDKQACLERWTAAGLPVPARYSPIRTYSQLREQIVRRHARLFIKLRYGYSAIGAVALEWRDDRVRAITTVEVAWSHGRPRLFLSKRPRMLLREFEVSWLIDTLAMEEVLVEEWLPKARWRGKPYDIRAVIIDGEPHHIVGRASASPFSNLNLDGIRIDAADLQQDLAEAWPSLQALCRQAAQHIRGAAMLGLDVLVRPSRSEFALLEANAFGDYLPNLMHRGRSTHTAQLHQWFPVAEEVSA